jgi:hypothetical protein
VGGSSISIDVKAANSKLAQMLRKREEDESLLQIGKRRIKDQAGRENAQPGRAKKAKRWSQPADFSYPSPLVDRPRTEAGSTSFHFSYTTISKEGSPTFKGKTLAGFRGAGRMPGADHSAYVERDGAAELSRGAEHAGYIKRPGAVELTSGVNGLSDELERTDSEGLGEDLLPEEKTVLGRVEWEASRSIFSNISDDPFEREEYWRAVHREEREAKVHSIVVDPSSSPQWWREVEAWKDVPDDFRKHCLIQRDRYEAWLRHEAQQPRGRPFVADPFTRTAERCGAAIVAAQNVPGWNVVDPPLKFKSGAGGKVQLRFVAELPHEITAEDRALIAQNFCDHLSSFAKDEAGRSIGLMYTAVIHAPDAHNDRRNYHLHVIAHPRPAAWLKEYNRWDFEVAEEYNHKGEIRVRYPFRQNKVGEVERKLRDDSPYKHAHYNNAIAGGDFIPAMRRKFAEINNAVLEARGIPRRLDPRRYEEMGIDRTPTEHLGTKAAAMEAMGVPTIIGRLNAIAIWNDAERAIRRRAAAVEAQLKSSQEDLRAFVDDAVTAALRTPETRMLRVLAAERETLVEHVAADRLEIMIFDHLEAKAKSRAVRTRTTCLQTLTEAERIPGSHSRETIKAVKKRYQEAQDHIERVNRELAPDRPRITAAADDVLAREKRIQEIDLLLAPLRAALMDAVERERSAKAKKKAERDRAAREVGPDQVPATNAQPSVPAPSLTTPQPTIAPTAAPLTPTPAPPIQTPAARPQPSIPPASTSPASGPVMPITTPTKPEPTEKENAQQRRSKSDLLRLAARLFLAPRESSPGGPGLLRVAQSLSSVRALSRGPLVRDADRPPVLLQQLSNAVVRRGPVRSDQGPGDDMRRPGTGDRSNAGRNGESSPRQVTETGAGMPAPMPPVLAPPSFQGVPIIEPTLPPSRDAITPASQPAAGVPDGLVPVRQNDPDQRPEPTVRAVVADLDAGSSIHAPTPPPGPNTPAPGDPKQSPPAPVSEPSAATTQPAEPTDKPPVETAAPDPSDGRRKPEDPTLFPVEESVGPTKPGSTKATYEEWDALVGRISRDRIPIFKKKDEAGRVHYTVPSLDPDASALLSAPRLAKRTHDPLAAIHRRQEREVERLACWIAKSGQDPSKLIIEDRTARLGDAPDSMRSLMRAWGSQPAITSALRSESDRRRQVAAEATRAKTRTRQQQAKPVQAPQKAAPGSAPTRARLAQLAAMYPDPADAHTPQVRTLIELLRRDAPSEQVQAAADAVVSDDFAREDVFRHRIELALAYKAAIEDDDTHSARAFNRHQDRHQGR